jgi:hypothetical protein
MAATNSFSVPSGTSGVTVFTLGSQQPRSRTIEIDNSAGSVDVFVNSVPLHATADRVLVAAGKSKAFRSAHTLVNVYADASTTVYVAVLAD